MALDLQCLPVHLLFLGDLNDHLAAQLVPALVHILAVLPAQADAGNGVDEDQGLPVHEIFAAQVVKAFQRLAEGQPLDLIQRALLPGQLHDGGRRTQGGQVRPHQCFVGVHPAGLCREDGLEVVVHPLFADELVELPPGAGDVGLLIVHADVKVLHLPLGGVLDLIHGKVCIFFQGLDVPAILRVPGHAAGNTDVQVAAAGQYHHGLLHGAGQCFQLFAQLLPAGIAVEQQQELVAGQAGAHGARRAVLRNAAAGVLDVVVTPVVAVGVVDVLEVVQVHHQQGCHAQPLRILEQFMTHAVECLPVVQAGEDVVVALPLDAQALLGSGGHILGQTHLHPVLGGDPQHDIAGAAALHHGQHLVPLRVDGAGAGQLDVLQQFSKGAHGQAAAVHLRGTQQGKEVFGHIHTAGVIPQLVAAQLHTGHVHDAQKLGGVGHKAAVQLGDGLRKAIQLPDAGVRKLGEGLFAVGCQHLAVELLGGAGQTAGHQQAAHSPQQQGEEHRSGDDLLHGAGKAEQDAAAHRAHQQPLFVGEGRVAAVQVQALDRRIAGLVVQRQPAFAVRLPAGDLFHARVDDVGIQSVARRQRQEQFRGRQARRCGHQQIGALPAVLQLLIRHLGFQIAGQDLHTDDAVHGAVRQDEGLGVGNGRALVTGELVGLGEPAAVIGGVQLFVILPGGLEHGAHKAAVGQAAAIQGGAPAFVGGDAQRLDHRRAGTLQHQVGVAVRGAGVRVQVPQVHAGHGAAHFLFRKVVGVDHKKDAGHGAGAQCTHQIGRGGFHQGVSGLAALVHRVQRNGAVLQHLLGQVVDGGGNVGELLCPDQHILQVAGAVAHLHVHDLLGVLVQPPGHIGQADAGRQQDHLRQQHRHHGKEDGAEDRLLGPVRFPRTVLFGRLHGTSPLSCRFPVVTLSRRTPPVQCRCPHTRHQSIRR